MRQFVRDTIAEAGNFIQSQRQQVRIHAEKASNDFATHVDHEVGTTIATRIREAFPQHAIRSEDGEVGQQQSGSSILWFIDPLDGTNNYIHGYPFYTVSMCCYDHGQGRFVASAVFSPFFDLLFEAYDDRPSTLNDEPIAVGQRQELSECLVLTGMSHKVADDSPELHAFNYISRATAGTRRSGCASIDICFVAAGYADAYYHFNLKPWDVLAGAHILQNAGGLVTNIASASFDFANRTIVASNGPCHESLQRALRLSSDPPADTRGQDSSERLRLSKPAGPVA